MTWEYLGSDPNPWGRDLVSDGGQSLAPKVQAYMGRIAELAVEGQQVEAASLRTQVLLAGVEL